MGMGFRFLNGRRRQPSQSHADVGGRDGPIVTGERQTVSESSPLKPSGFDGL